jgi:hypothetical protein
VRVGLRLQRLHLTEGVHAAFDGIAAPVDRAADAAVVEADELRIHADGSVVGDVSMRNRVERPRDLRHWSRATFGVLHGGRKTGSRHEDRTHRAQHCHYENFGKDHRSNRRFSKPNPRGTSRLPAPSIGARGAQQRSRPSATSASAATCSSISTTPARARTWCLEKYGRRRHSRTQQAPRTNFERDEQPRLLPRAERMASRRRISIAKIERVSSTGVMSRLVAYY